MAKGHSCSGLLLLFVVATAAVLMLAGCDSKVTFCATVDAGNFCATVEPGARVVALPAPGVQESDPGREWCAGDWRVTIQPSSAESVTIDGLPMVPCEGGLISLVNPEDCWLELVEPAEAQ